MTDPRPVVVAFDGSPAARAALGTAVELFAGRPLLVVSVWEPGLARTPLFLPDAAGLTYPLPSPEEVATVDRVEHERAGQLAQTGAAIARGLGAEAAALAVPDGGNVGETVAAIAEQHDAAAVVVGSRGYGAMRSTVLGSTSRALLHEAHRPVLVVHAGA